MDNNLDRSAIHPVHLSLLMEATFASTQAKWLKGLCYQLQQHLGRQNVTFCYTEQYAPSLIDISKQTRLKNVSNLIIVPLSETKKRAIHPHLALMIQRLKQRHPSMQTTLIPPLQRGPKVLYVIISIYASTLTLSPHQQHPCKPTLQTDPA